MANAKTISCTKCAAPLEIKNPRAKTAICAFCGAQIDLTSEDYKFLGVVQREPLVSPLKVGMVGHDGNGTAWEILGHIRFEEDRFHWDEYLLQSEDGSSFWIQYDDEKFSFYYPKRLTEPVEPLKCTGRFELGGKQYRCKGFGAASITHLEGELTWKARVGDLVRWLDAETIGMEWTQKEIEVFDLEEVSYGRVVEFFGITRAELKKGCYVQEDPDEGINYSGVGYDGYDDYDDDDDDDDGLDLSGLPASARLLIFGVIIVALMIGSFTGDCQHMSSYHRGYSGGGGYSFGK